MNKRKSPTCIFTSDWHLREDQPVARLDNYWTHQWVKVQCIKNLQKKYDCDVIHAGDLFDHWKPSPFLLRQTILHLPDQFYTIYGQHDLPQHNLDLVNKCGINVLEAANKLGVLSEKWHIEIKKDTEIMGIHWGQTPVGFINNGGKKVLVWHKMNYQGKKPWPGCTDPMAASLLRKYSQFDLIVTGDNHKTFHEEYEGRLLVNPGSLMRMDADQINHKPCVYLWYAEDNSIQVIHLPIESNVISREHIEVKEQRDARIDAFVSRLDGSWEAKMSFEDNLEQFFKTNNIRESVKQIIYQSIE